MTAAERAHPGVFITLEGVDGSGKSTQAESLAVAIERSGLDVVLTREPGGSPVAERIRAILLDPGAGAMAWATEVMLYLASRSEHVAGVIRPALERGAVVVCDRFLDSTLAYQAYGRKEGHRDLEASVTAIRRANHLGTEGLEPGLTLLLDLDPEVGLQRARDAGRGPDRLEGGGLDFLRRVRQGFLHLAEREPDRIKVVDGSQSESVIEEELRSMVFAHLSTKGLV